MDFNIQFPDIQINTHFFEICLISKGRFSGNRNT